MNHFAVIFVLAASLTSVLSGRMNVASAGDETVVVSYTIWVNTDVTEQYSLTVSAPVNSSFFQVMRIAELHDHHFVFEATEFSFGHYITKLAGHSEDKDTHLFWMLYVTKDTPNPASPPGNDQMSSVGVDGLIVDDGGNYLFWLKNI